MAVGKLWIAGVDIDWEAFSAQEQRRRLPLPTYPFERKRFWIEPVENAFDQTAYNSYKRSARFHANDTATYESKQSN